MPNITAPKKDSDTGLQPVSKVADFLCVSRAKLYAMMEQGQLPYVKIGKCRRVRWADVLQFVEDHTIPRA
jgi:excisionase family DNA binding protein